MKTIFIGTALGQSGYDVHTRSLARAFYRLNDETALEVPTQPGWERNVPGDVFSMVRNAGKWRDEDAVLVCIAQPHVWRWHLSRRPKAFYGFLVWEGDRIPRSWVRDLADERVTGVLVPSQHVVEAVKASTTNQVIIDKLHLVPHGVDHLLFKPAETGAGDKFVFLFNKGWVRGENDRSGLQFLLRAFWEEFGEDSRVELRCKINTAYGQPDINTALRNMGIPVTANIKFNGGHISDLQLAGVYNDCDVFVMPSMAEGFGLPALEAMSCGKPVITTSFGGQTDFVNERNGWLVGGEMVGASCDFPDFMYEGVRWLRPDLRALRGALREAFEKRGDGRGAAALQDSQKYGWDLSAKKLLSLFR